MRIAGIEAIALDIPLKKDFGGSTYHVLKRSTVVTRLRTEDGLVSEGRVPPLALKPVGRLGGDAYALVREIVEIPRPKVARSKA